MEEVHHGLWHKIREFATHWAVSGALIAITGLAPEEWLAHAFHHLHIPEETLHLWSAEVDLRIVPVAAGVLLLVGDAVWRRRRAHARAVPATAAARNPRNRIASRSRSCVLVTSRCCVMVAAGYLCQCQKVKARKMLIPIPP